MPGPYGPGMPGPCGLGVPGRLRLSGIRVSPPAEY